MTGSNPINFSIEIRFGKTPGKLTEASNPLPSFGFIISFCNGNYKTMLLIFIAYGKKMKNYFFAGFGDILIIINCWKL